MNQGLVYLVDDEEVIRNVLSRVFESIRLKVRAFVDARDFLSQYSTDDHPACLLVDLRLPGMSGLNLQEELKRRGVSIPIIFMSGYGDVPSCARAMKNGALEFLEKPFQEQELLDAVCSALDVDRRSAHLSTRAAVVRQRYRRLRAFVDARDFLSQYSTDDQPAAARNEWLESSSGEVSIPIIFMSGAARAPGSQSCGPGLSEQTDCRGNGHF